MNMYMYICKLSKKKKLTEPKTEEVMYIHFLVYIHNFKNVQIGEI